MSLNSPFVPSHVIIVELAASDKSSNKNCHNWIWPDPWETNPRLVDVSKAYGSVAADAADNEDKAAFCAAFSAAIWAAVNKKKYINNIA